MAEEEKKTTPNLNLPLIQKSEYPTTKVTDMIESIQGDNENSAFNLIDAAWTTKQDKIVVNPVEDTTLKARKFKIDGVVYKIAGDIDQVDSQMSLISENPVQNKVITAAINARPSTAEVETMIAEAISGKINRGY